MLAVDLLTAATREDAPAVKAASRWLNAVDFENLGPEQYPLLPLAARTLAQAAPALTRRNTRYGRAFRVYTGAHGMQISWQCGQPNRLSWRWRPPMCRCCWQMLLPYRKQCTVSACAPLRR